MPQPKLKEPEVVQLVRDGPEITGSASLGFALFAGPQTRVEGARMLMKSYALFGKWVQQLAIEAAD